MSFSRFVLQTSAKHLHTLTVLIIRLGAGEEGAGEVDRQDGTTAKNLPSQVLGRTKASVDARRAREGWVMYSQKTPQTAISHRLRALHAPSGLYASHSYFFPF